MKIKSNNFTDLLNNNFKHYDSFHLHDPVFSGNEKKYINNAIDSTFVSTVGKETNLLEQKISDYTKNKCVVACVNGTSALHISLMVAGVKKGDEVLTQSLSFVATANSIMYVNAAPIFIDVDPNTLGMSCIALEEFLIENTEFKDGFTYNKKTKKRIAACLPMHTFGFMCDIIRIKRICKKWNIILIEDAAEAFGSKFKGKNSGKFGEISVYSFNGNKIITSGGGGCILTQKKFLYKKAKHLTTTAKSSKNWEFIHNEIGYNYRMPNINSALLLAQLEQIDYKIECKKKLYSFYENFLPSIGIELLPIPKDTSWNYWLMSIRLDNKRDRNLFLKETNKNKIFTRPVWRLLFKLPMYKDFQRDSQKNALQIEKTVVNIPSNLLI